MQLKLANRTPSATCRHCSRAIQRGQWFLVQTMPCNPINDREFKVHVDCIRKLIGSAPEDETSRQRRQREAEEKYNEIKEKIAATGTAFYD